MPDGNRGKWVRQYFRSNQNETLVPFLLEPPFRTLVLRKA